MGERAYFTAIEGDVEMDETYPVFYGHWSGAPKYAIASFRLLTELMGSRANDTSYALARWGQIISSTLDGNLSWGMSTAKGEDLPDQDWGAWIITWNAETQSYQLNNFIDEYRMLRGEDEIIKYYTSKGHEFDDLDEYVAYYRNACATIQPSLGGVPDFDRWKSGLSKLVALMPKETIGQLLKSEDKADREVALWAMSVQNQ